MLQDDVVLTPLQFPTFGIWHPADLALLTKFDLDTHRSATASSSLSKSEGFAYEGRCSLANIAWWIYLSFAGVLCWHFLGRTR